MSEYKLPPSCTPITGTRRTSSPARPARRTLRAWLNWRPQVSTESLLLGVSLYLTLVFNTPFWRALLAGRSAQDGTFTYVLAVGVALTALNFVLLAPLLNRWTTKAPARRADPGRGHLQPLCGAVRRLLRP